MQIAGDTPFFIKEKVERMEVDFLSEIGFKESNIPKTVFILQALFPRVCVTASVLGFGNGRRKGCRTAEASSGSGGQTRV